MNIALEGTRLSDGSIAWDVHLTDEDTTITFHAADKDGAREFAVDLANLIKGHTVN